jgi:hypothetical protein
MRVGQCPVQGREEVNSALQVSLDSPSPFARRHTLLHIMVGWKDAVKAARNQRRCHPGRRRSTLALQLTRCTRSPPRPTPMSSWLPTLCLGAAADLVHSLSGPPSSHVFLVAVLNLCAAAYPAHSLAGVPSSTVIVGCTMPSRSCQIC